MAELPRQARVPTGETRLLVITLLVSVGVLILLAQFRFPDQSRTVAPVPATPLAQLADAIGLDEHAAVFTTLMDRLNGSVVTLRVPEDDARCCSPRLTGLRIGDDHALLWLPPSLPSSDAASVSISRLEAAEQGGWARADVVARDDATGFAMVRVPARPAPVLLLQPEPLPAPTYAAAVRSGVNGPYAEPVWLGRLDSIKVSAWPWTVIALPVAGSLPGAVLFTTTGRLLGVAAASEQGPVLVPGQRAFELATLLSERTRAAAIDAGFTVQALTGALQAATGVQAGVIVATVDPDGPAAQGVRIGDVIVGLESDRVTSMRDWSTALARQQRDQTATLRVLRGGARLDVPVRLRARVDRAQTINQGGQRSQELGLELRQQGDGVEVSQVAEDSAAARAGLQVRDRIVWLQGGARVTPAAIQEQWRHLRTGGAFIVGVMRAGWEQPRLVGLQKS
jgi:membrane-associated protease RseP (regulator of RpoE activity)